MTRLQSREGLPCKFRLSVSMAQGLTSRGSAPAFPVKEQCAAALGRLLLGEGSWGGLAGTRARGSWPDMGKRRRAGESAPWASAEEMESQLRAVESFLFFFLIDKLGQKEISLEYMLQANSVLRSSESFYIFISIKL